MDGKAETYFEWCDDASKDSHCAINTYSTDIVEKIAKIEGVLAQLVPAVTQLVPVVAIVVDAFKQH